ncbi:MAG TPA: penicillin-binding protein activator, partial [Pseudomonadales bacterium]|nr:penicillin-binding protein activator [Pseudomonadales bacterium]
AYYLLKAATLYAQAGKWNKSTDTLNSFSARMLAGAARADYVALAANGAFSRKRPEQALRYLTTDKFGLFDMFDGLPAEKQVEISQLRARAWYETGNYMASARERVYYANLLPAEKQADNERAIWQALMEIPTTQLKQVSEATPNGDLQGWLQLAYLSKSHQDDVNTQWQLVEQWANRWPSHPAAKRLPGNLAALKQVANEQINVVAVILSSDPKLAPASDAIRDGILAARYRALAQNQKTPEIKFYYHTGTAHFLDTYLSAIKDGANIVLGPLEKEQVRLLQQQPSLAVPTLALNYGQENLKSPSNLFQFGLASEDEARQAAEQAHKAGYTQAAMVYPVSEWGNRVATEFSKSWVELNGTVNARVAYTPGGDINKQLKQMLKIEASENRFKQLQRVISEPMRFTPRARKDIDYVFMLAVPDHARQIKPSISFLAGSSLPIYSTSLMYGATPNP